MKLRMVHALVGLGTWLDDVAAFFERIADSLVSAGLRMLPADIEAEAERAVGSVSVEGAHSGSTGNGIGQLEEETEFHGPYVDSGS